MFDFPFTKSFNNGYNSYSYFTYKEIDGLAHVLLLLLLWWLLLLIHHLLLVAMWWWIPTWHNLPRWKSLWSWRHSLWGITVTLWWSHWHSHLWLRGGRHRSNRGLHLHHWRRHHGLGCGLWWLLHRIRCCGRSH